jgi:hypothetical protein
MVPVPPLAVAFKSAVPALHSFSRAIETVGGAFAVSTTSSVAALQLVPDGPDTVNLTLTVPEAASVTLVLAAVLSPNVAVVVESAATTDQLTEPPAGTVLPLLSTVNTRSEGAPVLHTS